MSDSSQQVTLGCGTLILIAIIVMIFGSSGTSEIRKEVEGLREDVGRLEKEIGDQTKEIAALRKALQPPPGE